MVTFDEERRRQLMRISMCLAAALKVGDLGAARAALEDQSGWPNCVDPYLHCTVLSIALGAADLGTIRQLLDEGADPNFAAGDDGFPSLIDVLHHRCRDAPELPRSGDCHEVLRALVDAGADVNVRGLNDWTALHFAAAADDPVCCSRPGRTPGPAPGSTTTRRRSTWLGTGHPRRSRR
jgi:ankyrin repeat protein